MTSDCVIIFDTDGTLMDGRCAVIDAVVDGLKATYEHFELTAPPADRERVALAMGLPASTFFRTAYDASTVPADLRDAFVGEFEVRSTRAEVAALQRGETSLYEGAQETLAALHEQGYALALYSNATEPYFQSVIEVHGLDRWFDHTLSLEYAVRRRLARHKTGMVRYLARDHERAIVVGDRIHDVDAGRALGAKTVGCRYGFGDDDELSGADWCIDRLAELLGLPLATIDTDPDPGQRQAARG